MVAAHDDRAGLPCDVEHTERVGPARDEVADEDEAVARRESDAVEQSIELRRAPVNVADDDRTPHRLPSPFVDTPAAGLGEIFVVCT